MATVSTWRLTRAANPKNQKSTIIQVTTDGRPGKAIREAWGLESVDVWWEVEAESLKAAREKLDAGEGTEITRDGAAPVPARPAGSAPKKNQAPKQTIRDIPSGDPGVVRVCAECARDGHNTRMRGHLLHLHELDPGQTFRMEGRSTVLILKELTRGRARVTVAGGQSIQNMTPFAAVIPVEVE